MFLLLAALPAGLSAQSYLPQLCEAARLAPRDVEDIFVAGSGNTKFVSLQVYFNGFYCGWLPESFGLGANSGR